jgi:hypothetical protein
LRHSFKQHGAIAVIAAGIARQVTEIGDQGGLAVAVKREAAGFGLPIRIVLPDLVSGVR